MESKNFFCGIIKNTVVFLIVLSACLLVVSFCKGPFVEKHVIYRNNVTHVECEYTDCHPGIIESCNPTKRAEYTEFVYNFDGIVYFLGMIICVIFLFLILSPMKYGYHELMHETQDKDWSKKHDEKLDNLLKQISEINQNLKKIES